MELHIARAKDAQDDEERIASRKRKPARKRTNGKLVV
jgi:hypothetical protein